MHGIPRRIVVCKDSVPRKVGSSDYWSAWDDLLFLEACSTPEDSGAEVSCASRFARLNSLSITVDLEDDR